MVENKNSKLYNICQTNNIEKKSCAKTLNYHSPEFPVPNSYIYY